MSSVDLSRYCKWPFQLDKDFWGSVILWGGTQRAPVSGEVEGSLVIDSCAKTMLNSSFKMDHPILLSTQNHLMILRDQALAILNKDSQDIKNVCLFCHPKPEKRCERHQENENHSLLGTNIISLFWVDDVSFPMVGYGLVPFSGVILLSMETMNCYQGIPRNYHWFVLFDSPQMGALTTPEFWGQRNVICKLTRPELKWPRHRTSELETEVLTGLLVFIWLEAKNMSQTR